MDQGSSEIPGDLSRQQARSEPNSSGTRTPESARDGHDTNMLPPLVSDYSASIHWVLSLPRSNGNVIIAGPCAIESEEQIHRIAERVHGAGADILRGGAYKHRTSPYSFRGLESRGLQLLRSAGDRYGLPVISEILDPRDLPVFAEYVDIVQVGARNMRNYPLLRSLGCLSKPVLLKRSMEAPVMDWLWAAEHLLSAGVKKLLLCERGVRWHDPLFRNVLDLAAVAWLRVSTQIPLVVDVSHSTGIPAIADRVSAAALAAGAHGLMVEIHDRPSEALCDGQQAASPDIVRTMRAMSPAAQLSPSSSSFISTDAPSGHGNRATP